MPDARTGSRLLGGGAWALAGSGAETLLALAENALLARLLLPPEVGAFYLLLSVVTVTGMVGQLGMGQAVVRLVAAAIGVGRPGEARAVIRRVLGIGALGAGGAALLLAGGPGAWVAERLFRSPAMADAAILAGAWCALWTLRTLIAEVFRGLGDIRLASIFAKAAVALVSVAAYAALWAWRGSAGLAAVLGVALTSAALGLLVALVLLRRKTVALGPAPAATPPVLRFAFPLLLNNAIAYLLLHANLWLLGALADGEDVALYAAALRLSATALLPLVVVNAAVQPLIAELWAADRSRELERMLRAAAGAAALPGLAVGALLLALGRPLLGWVYGDFYAAAGVALALMVAGQLASLVTGSCGVTLIMTGHERLRLAITAVSAVWTVAAGYLLITRFGLVGAALNVAVGQALQNALAWIAVRARLGIWTHAGARGVGDLLRLLRGATAR